MWLAADHRIFMPFGIVSYGALSPDAPGSGYSGVSRATLPSFSSTAVSLSLLTAAKGAERKSSRAFMESLFPKAGMINSIFWFSKRRRIASPYLSILMEAATAGIEEAE